METETEHKHEDFAHHTIVNASDRHASAVFLADLLGLEPPTTYGPFSVVQVGDTSLDFADDHAAPHGLQPQHYAFLVSEADFDAIWERIRSRGLPYWADPFHQNEGINHNDGGRGLYWLDPDGHNPEILTVPYGGWPPQH
jgi:catechol 2,3-dioxygenase-like lactoylglutathione lyase family enzyme